MTTKITRENYREQLEIIAEQNGLEVVNTTEGRNGYPIGIMPMLKGFESFEQFQAISAEYPILNHFKLEKKDGWQLWYRQSDYFTDAFSLDDYANNVNNWYKHEKADYIYHSLLSTFEVFFSDVYQYESELGITLLDNGINYNDFEISNVEQGLQLWERNCRIVKELENKTFLNKENEEEDLSTYIDFDNIKKHISKYEKYFTWFDNKEPNKMLVENLNNGYIDESDIKVCSFYEDTYTYAMALGVDCLSDLEIEKNMNTEQELLNLINKECETEYQAIDEIDWIYISIMPSLSENFIRKFADKLDWNQLCNYQDLSEDIMREYADKLDWIGISITQTLSEQFIRDFADKFNWEFICRCQELTTELILEFEDKIDWEELYKNIDPKTLKKLVLRK